MLMEAKYLWLVDSALCKESIPLQCNINVKLQTLDLIAEKWIEIFIGL